MCCVSVFFFFKQKTAYDMRISDWSSDVCSSDLTSAFLIDQAEEASDSEQEVEIQEKRAKVTIHLLDVYNSLDYQEITKRFKVKGGWKRSEERRVGKERVSTCRSRWSPYH